MIRVISQKGLQFLHSLAPLTERNQCLCQQKLNLRSLVLRQGQGMPGMIPRLLKLTLMVSRGRERPLCSHA